MRYLLTYALGITTGVVAVLSLLWKPVQRPSRDDDHGFMEAGFSW